MENNVFIASEQGNLRYFGHQFNNFSVSNYSEDPSNDLKVFFGRMLHQLQSFESKIDDKLHSFLKNINDQKRDGDAIKFPILAPKASVPQKNVLDRFSQSENGKKLDFETSFLLSHSVQKTEKTKPSSQNQTRKFDLNKRRVEKIYRPLKILSRDARNDPFCDLPPLSEQEAQQGLCSLITSGIIPRDLDLAPAFQRNPPLSNFLIKMKEKPMALKKKINITQSLPLKDETWNLHLDTRTFITEKNPEDSIKPNLKITAPRSISSQRHLKNLQNRTISWQNVKLKLKNTKIYELDPVFQLFRKYNQSNWASIQTILKRLEMLLEENGIRFADINAEKVLNLASRARKVEKEELVDCVMNQEIIKNSMKLPTRRFTGKNAELLASLYIQKFWKDRKKRLQIKRKKVIDKMTKRIQQSWRVYKMYLLTKKTLKENYHEFIDDYTQILQKFQKEWPDIKGIERVEIHLNSFSFSECQRLTMENFLQRANSQIARIFACRDPLVEVIYITPIEIDEEIINYYSKVIQISEMVSFKEKVHFIFPEGSGFLPYTFSTSKKIIFSPQALKNIKKIIGLKPAYIVPGYPGENDLTLAKYLKLPCLCGNPLKALEFSSQKGTRELFLGCGLPIPPSSSRFASEEEFLNELVLLIYENLSVSTWIFKINTEFGGRGIASFTLDSSRLLNGLRSNRNILGVKEEIAEFCNIIRNLVAIKTVMACPFLYRSYREFMDEFLKQGGIIQATPPNLKPEHLISASVGLFIEPSGQYQLTSTYEKISGPDFRTIGYLMPSRSLSSFNISSICEGLVPKLLDQQVFGYVSLDLLIFPDSQLKGGPPLFWAIGMDCFMNDFVSGLYYFEFLVKAKPEIGSGRYFAEQGPMKEDVGNTNVLESGHEDDSKAKVLVEKFLIYCPSIIHPGLAELEYRDFFHKCRQDGILFDLEKKSGSSFLLIDALKNCFLGLLGIGDHWRGAVKNMTETLNFILQHAGSTSNPKFEKKNKDIRHDSIALSDIVNKIRNLNKALEKEMEKNGGNFGRKSLF